MKRIIPFVVALGFLAFHPGTAHADESPLFWGVEITPAVMAVVDAGSQPTSKTYGGFEVAVGGTAAAMNVYAGYKLATDESCSGCTHAAPYVFGVALVDLAVAAHGTYLLVRREEPARVQVTPTIVDEHGTAGLAVAGRF